MRSRFFVWLNRTVGEAKMFFNRGFRGSGHFARYLDAKRGQVEVSQLLAKQLPCMIARSGLVELRAVAKVVYGYQGPGALSDLCMNAGFFPNDEVYLECFTDIYRNAARDVDLFGAWNYRHGHFQEEQSFFIDHCPRAILTDIHALDFLDSDQPWTRQLCGKRVLVVHPLKEDILRQYEKRRHLFENAETLPDFGEITVIKSVQSAGGGRNDFKTWFEALNFMKSEIDAADYEVAIIGAGAYGLPLASYIKSRGKMAVHLGGMTQMLFGIYGRRWEQSHKHFINRYWIRPSPEARPPNYIKIENGCYW